MPRALRRSSFKRLRSPQAASVLSPKAARSGERVLSPKGAAPRGALAEAGGDGEKPAADRKPDHAFADNNA